MDAIILLAVASQSSGSAYDRLPAPGPLYMRSSCQQDRWRAVHRKAPAAVLALAYPDSYPRNIGEFGLKVTQHEMEEQA